ncbi:hypothetical protein GCM10022281_22760 [Sphingomonas rosea]|uniref:EAL domain-containing protein n=1 Tax=Sphingomonas rosea TaxID=335605 RepID=A0ABP7UDW7_9SPHN
MLWTTLASILFGVLGIGSIAEDALRAARNSTHLNKASGDIVFVGVDDQSLSKIGKWPWNRELQAKMIDQATQAGADRIFMDIIYDSPGSPREDDAFEGALKRSGRVTLADRAEIGPNMQKANAIEPIKRFSRWTNLANITAYYNYQNAIWQLHYYALKGDTKQPGFAAALAHHPLDRSDTFRIDYSTSPFTVPYLSASDLLNGKAKGRLAGKAVIIGLNADQLGDQYWIPGYGRMAGSYVQILGAETLKRGSPVELGWLLPLLLALGTAVVAIFRARGIRQGLILSCFGIALLVGPIPFEQNLIFVDITPALLALIVVGSNLAMRTWRQRGLVNAESGLPNLTALRALKSGDGTALVVARVHNHSELRAALSESEQRDADGQIVARLNASGSTKLYQGEDGTFVWMTTSASTIGNHLEALHSMFRSPISVKGRQIDVALSFGVELGTGRSTSNRLASAVLAADEAWTEGLRWKLHDPARQEEMNWRVSLLGELDQAIDNGEVWLAYQPQLEIGTGRIIGAEALARWTHPQKGPISPTEFITAAEQNGRIGKLTDFVLDRAISSAAAINRRGVPFQVAVNLSARLLTDRELLARIEKMLESHGLDPARLTLELTETASLQDADSGLATLDALRRNGVRIAIDDYGTGLSTLDYLKKIPANEIKIDQSFVKAMRVNRSDLIMVQSTIALAHSLGRSVVAEGVEDKQCLDELTRMGCDVAQGFAIGRPMGVRELVQRLQVRSTRQVA